MRSAIALAAGPAPIGIVRIDGYAGLHAQESWGYGSFKARWGREASPSRKQSSRIASAVDCMGQCPAKFLALQVGASVIRPQEVDPAVAENLNSTSADPVLSSWFERWSGDRGGVQVSLKSSTGFSDRMKWISRMIGRTFLTTGMPLLPGRAS